jgi:cellulose synthase/poly-beta-1,6-N-acetylglucosamine synthase-like glycosyltransferase
LAAIAAQTRPADRIVVVRRDTDTETATYLAAAGSTFGPLSVAEVSAPGQVAALNCGLSLIDTDIVAITDDDAAPRPDWLARIEKHFADPRVGGGGGRDYIASTFDEPGRSVVGILQWHGRTIGNHHRGTGPPRSVDILKGANMSYRMAAVGSRRFDIRLWGGGAQVHNDLAFSLAMRRAGWTLMYDPDVAVDHYPAERFDDDRRNERSLSAIVDSAHNETLVVLENLSRARRTAFWLWAFAVGTRDLPGMLQCVRLAGKRKGLWREFRAVITGRLATRSTLRHDRAAFPGLPRTRS